MPSLGCFCQQSFLAWQSKSMYMGIYIPRSCKNYDESWKAFSTFLLEEKVIRNWMSKRGWNHRKLSNRKNHDLIEDALSKQLLVEESIRFSFEQLKVAFDWLQIFSNCHWWNIFDTWLDEMNITVWELGVGERVHLNFSPSLGLGWARVGILLQVRCEWEVTRVNVRMITRASFGKTLKMHENT